MAKKKKQEKKGKNRRGGPTPPPEVTRVKWPNKRNGEMFARVVDIYGNERMQVFCEDGKHRIGRIRGKIKKRVCLIINKLKKDHKHRPKRRQYLWIPTMKTMHHMQRL